MGFKRRNILKTIGASSVAVTSFNASSAAKATSLEEAFRDVSSPDELPDSEAITGKQKGKLISRIKRDEEVKRVLAELKNKKWHPDFRSGRFRSVGDNEYAVVPLRNNHVSEKEQGYLLWVKENLQDTEGPEAVAYRMLESETITTRVENGTVVNEVNANEDLETVEGKVGTEAVLAPGGGGGSCSTCTVPVSRCPWLDQNWFCFVDIVGYVISLPAFFIGCGTCFGSLGIAQPACWACAGAILRGSPANLPCDKGFYTDCYISDYRCVSEEYEHRWC